MRVAKGNCSPNLTIAFTDGAGWVARYASNHSQTGFDNVPVRERAAYYYGTAPIRWWHTVEIRSSDGARAIDAPGQYGGGQEVKQYRSSIVSTQMVRALTSASEVVDVRYAEGKLLDSVADFGALVGLAEIRPVEPPPPVSILSLFKSDLPVQLTALDLNFLSTLCRLPLDRTALMQRGLRVRGLTKAGSK